MSASAPQVPQSARAFLTLASLLGAAAIVTSVITWDVPDLLKFIGFLSVAACSSGVRLNTPGVAGTLSPTFLFALLGILDLRISETVILVSLVTAVECYRNHSKLPAIDQLAFTVGSAAFASGAAAWLYHAPWMEAQHLEPMLRLAITTMAFFLLNTFPVAIAVSLSEDLPVFSLWRDGFFWALPYYLGAAIIAKVASIGDQVLGWPTVLLSGPVVYLIYRSYRLHLSRLESDKSHAEAVSSLHLRTIEALALAIEAKDQTTHDHLARVQVYAREMGKDLGLTPSEMEALQAASLLHDIGKLAVPEHIISKPGRLTPEEFEKMKIHPTVGAEILERVQFPYPVVPIVRAHHEKWDGSGYPAGLKGEEIPMGARILAAVDCLDALASDRQYRRALPLDEAMRVVQKESGKAFDPRVVDVLLRRYVELERMAKAHSPVDAGKLSTEAKIVRGLAPDAGFEAVAAGASTVTQEARVDFLTSIAAARQEVQALFEISQELGSSLSLEQTLSMLGVRLRNIVPYHSIAIWVRREDLLMPEYVAGDDYRLFSGLEIPVGQGLSGWVAENRKPILNGNPTVESSYQGDAAKVSTLRSAVAVPLEGTGGVAGVLTLYHTDGDAFTRDHLRILLAISSKIAISIENALRFRQAESSATTDFLTNLPNARSLFLQLDAELSRARRGNQPLSALVLDLDGFKQINDRFGHLEGNRVLRGVAKGLKSVCREYDCVARMGGDEFVVLLPGARASELEARIYHLRNVVSSVCHEMFSGELLTVSIGVAQYPDDGTDAEQLLAEADKRMYKEKRDRRQEKTDAIHPSLVPRPAAHSTVH